MFRGMFAYLLPTFMFTSMVVWWVLGSPSWLVTGVRHG